MPEILRVKMAKPMATYTYIAICKAYIKFDIHCAHKYL